MDWNDKKLPAPQWLAAHTREAGAPGRDSEYGHGLLSVSGACPQEPNYRRDYFFARFGLQPSCFRRQQALMSGEEFSGPDVAVELQRALGEVGSTQRHSGGISVGFAGNLAEYPVAPASLSQHHGRSELGTAQV